MRRFSGLLVGAMLLCSPPLQAEEPLDPLGVDEETAAAEEVEFEAAPLPFDAPTDIRAKDTPHDGGGSITVHWDGVAGAATYRVERSQAGGPFEFVDDTGPQALMFQDSQVKDGESYVYRVVAVGPAGEEGVSLPSLPAVSFPQWFKGNLTGVLIAAFGFMALVLWFIRRAKSGKKLFIRRIAGLEAVDEAVGRATEMGRPILYVPGTGYISDISTIASLNVLGEITKKAAAYGTKLNVPNRDPIVFTVAREIVKGAYIEAGRPDAYDPDSVHFVVEHALAFAAAVSGIMVRERPATNFLLGSFGGESLILAETGASTGAIQIAGTEQTTQLPFFVVACDYTLVGEELFAASAYLSREPLMVGALKGEDWGKFVMILILVIGTAISLIVGFDSGIILRTVAQ